MTQKKAKTATKQANPKVSPISGVAPPADKQFGKPNGNPRHNGAWKKEDTGRFKLEQMMKLTESEIQDVLTDLNRPYFERNLAQAIYEGDWKTMEAMMNQVYGAPKQVIETPNIEYKPLVDLTKRKKNGEKK